MLYILIPILITVVMAMLVENENKHSTTGSLGWLTVALCFAITNILSALVFSINHGKEIIAYINKLVN